MSLFRPTDTAKEVRLWLVAAAVIVADQLTKAMILNGLPLYEIIPVIPNFLNITHIHNPGGAFGMLADQGPMVRKLVFLVISSLAVVAIYWFHRRLPQTHTWLLLAMSMIFGGAIGNLIDRFRFGAVVDFLDVYVGAYHWPAFNVADSAITVGVTIFVVHMVFDKMPE